MREAVEQRDTAGSLDRTWPSTAGIRGEREMAPRFLATAWEDRRVLSRKGLCVSHAGRNPAAGSGRRFSEVWGADGTVSLQGWAAFGPQVPRGEMSPEDRGWRREKQGQPGLGLEELWTVGAGQGGQKLEEAERTGRSGRGAGDKARPCDILGLREAHPCLVGAMGSGAAGVKEAGARALVLVVAIHLSPEGKLRNCRGILLWTTPGGSLVPKGKTEGWLKGQTRNSGPAWVLGGVTPQRGRGWDAGPRAAGRSEVPEEGEGASVGEEEEGKPACCRRAGWGGRLRGPTGRLWRAP